LDVVDEQHLHGDRIGEDVRVDNAQWTRGRCRSRLTCGMNETPPGVPALPSSA